MLARWAGHTTDCPKERIWDRDLFGKHAACAVAIGFKPGTPKSLETKRRLVGDDEGACGTVLDQTKGKRASVVGEFGPLLAIAADLNLADIATPRLLTANVADTTVDLLGRCCELHLTRGSGGCGDSKTPGVKCAEGKHCKCDKRQQGLSDHVRFSSGSVGFRSA